MTMKLVYIAGPFAGVDDLEIEGNIVRAERVADVVRKLGAFPVTPHSIGRNFKHAGDRAYWLAGTLELMRRCDAVMLVPGWQASDGTMGEIAEATNLRIPVFSFPGELSMWLLANARKEAPPEPTGVVQVSAVLKPTAWLPKRGQVTDAGVPPITGAEFVEKMQAIVQPLNDEELREVIADIESH